MTYNIPSVEDVKQLLKGIKQPELFVLEEQSGVPVSTLLKIRHGVTHNPGIDTVRRIYAADAVKKIVRRESAGNCA